MASGVANGEAAADGVQAQTGTLGGSGKRPTVFDLQNEMVGLMARGNRKKPLARGFAHAEFEGIFDDGLKDKTGDKNLPGPRRGRNPSLQFLSKAGFLNFEVGGGGIQFDGERGDEFMAMIEGVFKIGGEFIHHDRSDSRMGGNLGGNAVEGIKKKVGVELEADELKFHLLNLRLRVQLLDFFLLQQKFSLEPEISKRPGQVNEPHKDGKEDPAWSDGNGLAIARGWADQIEKGHEALQNGGVGGGGEAGDEEGLKNETGATQAQWTAEVKNPAKDAGESKTESDGGEGNLEGAEKVLPQDGTNEKSDKTEPQPKNQIDLPEAGGMKKMLTETLEHKSAWAKTCARTKHLAILGRRGWPEAGRRSEGWSGGCLEVRLRERVALRVEDGRP